MRHHSLDLARPAGDPSSPIHARDARAKILALVAITVVAVATPPSAWPAYAGCAAALAGFAALARVGPGELWPRAWPVLGLVLAAAVFVPVVRTGGQAWSLGPVTVHEEGLAVLAAIAAKASIGTFAAVLLAATTPFPELLRGLEALRVPRLLVTIAGAAYRYLFVVAGEAARMRAALVARAYRPRHALQAAAIGHAAGALFLRAHARGERVHLAMLARGFDGAMPRPDRLRFGLADAALVAAVLLVTIPSRILA